jgi:hypothetical protein
MPVAFSEDAWRDYRNNWPAMKRELLNAVDFRLRQGPTENQNGADAFQIPFRNDSGETIPAYAAMRVTGVVTAASVPVITVAKPSSTFQGLYLVNGPLPVASSGEIPSFGTWADQAGFVLYDDANTPAMGEEWGPYDGSWEIKKYRYGFTILGGATGGSTDIVGVVQRQVHVVFGKSSAGITAGSNGTVTIYDGNQTTTGHNISATNRTEIAIGANTWCEASWFGGTWFAKPWECP